MGIINIMFYPIMPLFLSHVAVQIRGLCSVYIVYGAKDYTEELLAIKF